MKAAQKYVNTSSTDILSQSGNVDNPQKPNPAVQGPSTTSAVVSVQLPNLETDLMSPYDDGISGNPVGELQVRIYKLPLQTECTTLKLKVQSLDDQITGNPQTHNIHSLH